MNSKLIWGAAAASLLAVPLYLAKPVATIVATNMQSGAQAAAGLAGVQPAPIAAQRPVSAPASTTKLASYQADAR